MTLDQAIVQAMAAFRSAGLTDTREYRRHADGLSVELRDPTGAYGIVVHVADRRTGDKIDLDAVLSTAIGGK